MRDRELLERDLDLEAGWGAVMRPYALEEKDCHTFPPSLATHLLERGHGIRTIQELMGHANLNRTMIDTHLVK